MPANSACWDVLLLQTSGGTYVARHGVLSTGRNSAAQCPRLTVASKTTAPMAKVMATTSARIDWIGESKQHASLFGELARLDCSARELLQFARAPFASQVDGHWVIGDLRFDREPEPGFAEIELAGGVDRRCLHDVPWVAPRAALGTATGKRRSGLVASPAAALSPIVLNNAELA